MHLRKLLTYFITWRVFLFVILFFAITLVPLQNNFLGGGITNYLQAPYYWSWANFDGEHYLNIAQNGYGNGEQAFFPLYPSVLRYFSSIFGRSLFDLAKIGFWLSNISFFMAFWGLFKLLKVDYSEKVTEISLLLLMLFPTSFYLGSVYTESVFLALIVWSFYLARKDKWFWASILGALASATRVLGIVLFPALVAEFWFSQQKRKLSEMLPLLIIPLGLLYYMYFSYSHFGDPLKFVHVLPSFGEQRQITPVILPQVFYRYIMKILPNISYHFFPVIFTTYMEIFTAAVFLILIILAFFKLRTSYAVFGFFGYLIPTLSGSFSSLPRYVLIIFPAFLLAAIYLDKYPKFYTRIVFTILIAGLIIATSLFVRGYWVS